MQVFKTFFKISLRFFPSTIVYIVIFGVLSFILPNTTHKNTNQSFKAEQIKIAVIDRDNSELSQRLYDYLDEHQKIVDIGTDESTWRDDLFYHNVVYILVIEEGMEDKILSGKQEELFTAYEDPASNTSYIAASQIDTYVSTLKGYIKAGFSPKEAADKTADTVSLSADVSFIDAGESTDKPSAGSYYFTYIPYILLCMLINSLGPMLVIWNRPEIKSRTSISSLSFGKRNSALFGAAGTYSLFTFAILIVFAAVMYKGELFDIRGLLYIANAFIYLLVCISLTFLIAQLTKHVNMLNMWANVIGLSSSFLCGIFVQRSLLPDKVIAFSKVLPTYWYINVTEELRFFDGSLSSFALKSMGIQLLFALAFLAVSLVIIKFKEQRNNPA